MSTPVLIEAALNGRAAAPAPWTPEEAAEEGRRAVEAGAAMVHVHGRTSDGAQSSDPEWYARFRERFDATCPGVPVSYTSRVAPSLLDDVAAWDPAPAVCSVNYAHDEDPWRELLDVLERRGIAIEAGVADEAMIDAVGDHPLTVSHFVILVEAADPSRAAAAARYLELRAHTAVACPGVPIVAHGYGDATWGIVGAALAAGDHVRVGLEDAKMLPDGREIRSNADLVENAVRIAEALGRTPIGPEAVATLLAPAVEAAPR